MGRGFWIILIPTLLLQSCGVDHSAYIAEIEAKRDTIDMDFKGDHSPLDSTDRPKFKGLTYFEVDPDYKVEAKVEHIDELQLVRMPTSNNKEKEFFRWAHLSFQIDGRDLVLTAFKRYDPFGKWPMTHNVLFIPFTDETTGNDSYGTGRYIEMELPAENAKTLTIDFNTCFNPYCAYGSGWSCPVPPIENKLNIRVEAGVKKYDKEH